MFDKENHPSVCKACTSKLPGLYVTSDVIKGKKCMIWICRNPRCLNIWKVELA